MLDWGAKPRRQELSTYSTFTPDSATTFRVGWVCSSMKRETCSGLSFAEEPGHS
jgi:hypothetical protein